jgi:GGDEF domain-containing protein
VIRLAHVAARLGGDEFITQALGLNELDRARIEKRIRDYLASAHIIAAVGRKVGVSVGWAARSSDESSTLEDMLRAADRAMYRQGHQGTIRLTPGRIVDDIRKIAPRLTGASRGAGGCPGSTYSRIVVGAARILVAPELQSIPGRVAW